MHKNPDKDLVCMCMYVYICLYMHKYKTEVILEIYLCSLLAEILFPHFLKSFFRSSQQAVRAFKEERCTSGWMGG